MRLVFLLLVRGIDLLSRVTQSLALAWLPRADGVFLKDDPMKLVQQGSVANVPFVTGMLLASPSNPVLTTFKVIAKMKGRCSVCHSLI